MQDTDREGSMLRYVTSLPNLFTSASIFCGLLSLSLAANATAGDSDNLYKAALAIIFATLFDALDGRVARMTRTASEFGVQYDSLADVVSFGVAPAFLVYKWGLAFYGGLGLAVAFIYLVAGAMRLARFNITTQKIPRQWSQGLTITESGGTLAVLIIIHHRSGAEYVTSHASVVATVIILAYLMVSNIRFRTFKELRVNQRSFVGIILGFLAATYVLMVYRDFAFVLLFGLVVHIGSGLIEEVVFFKQRRLEEKQGLFVEHSNAGNVSLEMYEDEAEEDNEDEDLPAY